MVQFVVNESGNEILVNVRPNSFSVTINTATVYNFDAAGRLFGAYRSGRNYLRGLDNRVLVKWGAGHGLARRSRCDLNESEKQAFFAEMIGLLAVIEQAVCSGKISGVTQSAPEALPTVLTALAQVRPYEDLHEDAVRFSAIYKPVSILPPDQYLALVLQATEGCSWNKCTFCDFYRDRPFHIKSDAEFRRHIRDVVVFFGPALRLRGTVFLADANALVIPQKRLLSLLDVLASELTVTPASLTGDERQAWLRAHPDALRGIYSFVDAFSSRHKTATDYRELAQRNVKRVYIGMESGDDELLAFLRKGSTAQDARDAVSMIKAGGVDVGVILMIGAGGQRFARQHVAHSIAALNSMGLGERDIIYFSPFMDYPGSEYSRQATQLGVQPLSGAEMDEQIQAIRAGLVFAAPQQRPKIALYDIREFIY